MNLSVLSKLDWQNSINENRLQKLEISVQFPQAPHQVRNSGVDLVEDFRSGNTHSAPPKGRTALVLWILGTLLVICCAAAYRPAIDYARADGREDAIKAFPSDSRYLALEASQPSVILPANRSLPPDEPLEIGRDMRLLPAVSGTDHQREQQNTYLASYDSAIATLVHGAAHDRPVTRPTPISRPVFALWLTLTVLPFLVGLYLRYRLGPYRLDGQPWTVSFYDIAWRYMRPSTYAEQARPLLHLLWFSVAIFPPWVFLIASRIKDRPLQ